MTRLLTWILIALLGLLIVLLVLQKATKSQNQIISPSKIEINGREISVELADSPDERTRGLMFREELDKNAGMLFVFEDENVRSFWMKNTLIPLDIIWIDSEKKIVHIEKDVPPCETSQESPYCTSYTSEEKAKYVLEVNSGWTEKHNISIGDKVNFLE